ncbi:amino acid ABC transporter ATP-binding protein [bacterium]|nr:amino acid ABC transporter ATP-binding protein [bacterium]MCB9476316.1 amino acid ABC transporter ATP-binding protein [Deltaproteobacteria bacterium]
MRSLRFENVSKSFAVEKDRRVAVLRDVSFELTAPGVVGLAGRSGSGKSTLFRLVNRLADPDGGRILADGEALGGGSVVDLRRRFVLCPQRAAFFPGSVLDNVTAPDWMTKRGEGDVARGEVLLERVEIPPERWTSEPSALSVGQQMRVQIARCLYLSPDLLMLDESTANLDPHIAGRLLDDLARWAREDSRLLLHATHEPDKLRRCDRMLVLEAGRIVADGPPARLLDDERGPAAAILRAEAD